MQGEKNVRRKIPMSPKEGEGMAQGLPLLPEGQEGGNSQLGACRGVDRHH